MIMPGAAPGSGSPARWNGLPEMIYQRRGSDKAERAECVATSTKTKLSTVKMVFALGIQS